MSDDIKTVEVSEIVTPDNTRWPVPRGYLIALANDKGYFFAPISITGNKAKKGGKAEPGDSLIEAYNRAMQAHIDHVSGNCKPSVYYEAVGGLAVASLTRQYSDGVIDSVLADEAIDARHFADIVAAVSGVEPYTVRIRKN